MSTTPASTESESPELPPHIKKLTKADAQARLAELEAAHADGPPPADTGDLDLGQEVIESAALEDYADKATAILEEHNYAGKLTRVMFRHLEPLLREPLPRKYIETTPPTDGKPYVSTGVKSAQVQIDRLNAVLGASHWRALVHFSPGKRGNSDWGEVARVWVVVGNELERCCLDDEGDLVPYTAFTSPPLRADVLVSREGYGGHARGSAPGDVRKGAETNALKRVIARIGPGADVYRLDYDEDTHASKPEVESSSGQRGPRRARSAPPPAPVDPETQALIDRDPANGGQGQARPTQAAPAADPGVATPEELEEAIKALLEEEAAGDQVRSLRKAANAGMLELGAPPAQRLRELEAAKGERPLEGLVNRIERATAGHRAAQAQDAAEKPDPPAPEPESQEDSATPPWPRDEEPTGPDSGGGA